LKRVVTCPVVVGRIAHCQKFGGVRFAELLEFGVDVPAAFGQRLRTLLHQMNGFGDTLPGVAFR
jgi:hypothetical protein